MKTKKEIKETKEAEEIKEILEFSKISKEEEENYKKVNKAGFIEFFIPNFGYLYFRNLNINQIQEVLTSYAPGFPKKTNFEEVISEIISDTLILKTSEEIKRHKVIDKLVYEKPMLGTQLIGCFMAEAQTEDGISFRSIG